MSYKDLFKKDAQKHVDTPEQAAARREAAEEAKARAERSAAKQGSKDESKGSEPTRK